MFRFFDIFKRKQICFIQIQRTKSLEQEYDEITNDRQTDRQICFTGEQKLATIKNKKKKNKLKQIKTRKAVNYTNVFQAVTSAVRCLLSKNRNKLRNNKCGAGGYWLLLVHNYINRLSKNIQRCEATFCSNLMSESWHFAFCAYCYPVRNPLKHLFI